MRRSSAFLIVISVLKRKPAYIRESVYFILVHEIMATISKPKLIINDKT
ncbi:hypothetical protein HNR32_002055 [Pectinatus brassicae]|uniref:Uncharacterized protein n=1 Tax=Pectinatus brassicae TaxID=862415 RepID=A0A840UL59_9FIRM|nr:hypothetical protein [Pectinatus brassicae]